MAALGHFWGIFGVIGLIWLLCVCFGYNNLKGSSGLFGVKNELWHTFGDIRGYLGLEVSSGTLLGDIRGYWAYLASVCVFWLQ